MKRQITGTKKDTELLLVMVWDCQILSNNSSFHFQFITTTLLLLCVMATIFILIVMKNMGRKILPHYFDVILGLQWEPQTSRCSLQSQFPSAHPTTNIQPRQTAPEQLSEVLPSVRPTTESERIQPTSSGLLPRRVQQPASWKPFPVGQSKWEFSKRKFSSTYPEFGQHVTLWDQSESELYTTINVIAQSDARKSAIQWK